MPGEDGDDDDQYQYDYCGEFRIVKQNSFKIVKLNMFRIVKLNVFEIVKLNVFGKPMVRSPILTSSAPGLIISQYL